MNITKLNEDIFVAIFEYGNENSGRLMYQRFVTDFKENATTFANSLCDIDRAKWDRFFKTRENGINMGYVAVDEAVEYFNKRESEAEISEKEMQQIAETSPALKWKSDKEGRFSYPANFRDRVPLKVQVAKTIYPDFSFLKTDEKTVCQKDNVYFVWVNSYGAVSAILPNNKKLGLLPSEFDVVEWHKE